ncbi:unnamed protein product [Calypogeia fissa]
MWRGGDRETFVRFQCRSTGKPREPSQCHSKLHLCRCTDEGKRGQRKGGRWALAGRKEERQRERGEVPIEVERIKLRQGRGGRGVCGLAHRREARGARIASKNFQVGMIEVSLRRLPSAGDELQVR